MLTITDPANLPEACHHDTPDAQTTIGYCRCCDKTGEAECPHCHSHQFQCDPPENHAHKLMSKMRQLLMHASEQKNSKFYLGIILIATGDPASGARRRQRAGSARYLSRTTWLSTPLTWRRTSPVERQRIFWSVPVTDSTPPGVSIRSSRRGKSRKMSA